MFLNLIKTARLQKKWSEIIDNNCIKKKVWSLYWNTPFPQLVVKLTDTSVCMEPFASRCVRMTYLGLLVICASPLHFLPAQKRNREASVTFETVAPLHRQAPTVPNPRSGPGSVSGASCRGAAAAASPLAGYQSSPRTGVWRRAKPSGSMNCNDYLFPNIGPLLTSFMSSRLLTPCLPSEAYLSKLPAVGSGPRVLSRCIRKPRDCTRRAHGEL